MLRVNTFHTTGVKAVLLKQQRHKQVSCSVSNCAIAARFKTY